MLLIGSRQALIDTIDLTQIVGCQFNRALVHPLDGPDNVLVIVRILVEQHELGTGQPDGLSRSDLIRCGLAVALGLLIALPQLLPELNYVLHSAASYFRNQYKPLYSSPRSLLEFLTPEFFGTSSPLHRWGSHEGGFFGLGSLLLAASFLFGSPGIPPHPRALLLLE